MFITFEGGEGSGKTTLIQGLKEYLNSQCVDFVLTREPGGNTICEAIRTVLKDDSLGEMTKKCEMFLLSASRTQLCNDIIVPALNQGKLVLCDRFYDSSIVYQGIVGELGEEFVRSVTNLAIGNLKPDLTFYLDISPIDAFNRKNGPDKNDRFEQFGIEFHEKVRQGYLKLAQNERERFVIIDANKPKEQVLMEVLNTLREKDLIK